jgi:hypothetical protein
VKLAVSILISAALFAPTGSAEEARFCADDQVLASGEIDETVFSRFASRGIRGEWCERYDARGHAERSGLYRERYPGGALRLEATYVDGRLEGPVVAYHENGRVFLRGALVAGAWQGALSLHHENGTRFWSGRFEDGRLDGRVELRHPDGGLAAETHFQQGREDGAARSFYARTLGGGVQSEVYVEADAFVGLHRVFDTAGRLRLRADRDGGPAAWRPTPPVASSADDEPRPARRTGRAADD